MDTPTVTWRWEGCQERERGGRYEGGARRRAGGRQEGARRSLNHQKYDSDRRGAGVRLEGPSRRFLQEQEQELRREFQRLGIGACLTGQLTTLLRGYW